MLRLALRVAALTVFTCVGLGHEEASAQQIRLRMGHDQPVGSMYDEGHADVPQAGRGAHGRASQGRGVPGGAARLRSRRCSKACGWARSTAASPMLRMHRPWCPSWHCSACPICSRTASTTSAWSTIRSFASASTTLVASKNLGIKVVGYYSAGVRNFYTRRGPATTPGRAERHQDPRDEQPGRGEGLEYVRHDPHADELRRGLSGAAVRRARRGRERACRDRDQSRTTKQPSPSSSPSTSARSVCSFMNERKLTSLPPICKRSCWQPRATPRPTSGSGTRSSTRRRSIGMKAKGAQIVVPDRASFAARIASDPGRSRAKH